jgi:hypothetical protein
MNTVLGKRPEELSNLQGKEIIPIIRKLDTFTERVCEDIDRKLISKADGQKLIVNATIMVSMLTTA